MPASCFASANCGPIWPRDNSQPPERTHPTSRRRRCARITISLDILDTIPAIHLLVISSTSKEKRIKKRKREREKRLAVLDCQLNEKLKRNRNLSSFLNYYRINCICISRINQRLDERLKIKDKKERKRKKEFLFSCILFLPKRIESLLLIESPFFFYPPNE